jgi:hypothetical protein
MKTFAEQLSSTSWWLSVVIVGIAINVTAAYIKSRLDGVLSNASSWWKGRSEREKEKRQKLIEKLKNSKEEQFLAVTDDLRERIRAIHMLLLGVFFMLIPEFIDLGKVVQPIILGTAGLTYFLSFLVFQRGARIKSLLNEARKSDTE